jgi:hypothetical protein
MALQITGCWTTWCRAWANGDCQLEGKRQQTKKQQNCVSHDQGLFDYQQRKIGNKIFVQLLV